MGEVYWNAALVVAASGARDSSEALFVSERPLSTVLRLPYRVAGERKGTFNMMQSPKRTKSNDGNPTAGPLDRRAWTLQERYLARRLTTFMPNCISWVCNMANVTETGKPFRGFNWQKNWSSLLAEYTTRSLTFASNSIEAPRGIAALYQSHRKDRYIPEYGVWEEDLVFQLLWFKDGSCFDDGRLANMPSCSWAATQSAKRWPSENTDPVWDSTREAKEMPERLVITSAGHLRVFGHLSTIQPAPSYVRDEFTARDLKLNDLKRFYYQWNKYPPGFHLLTQDIDGSYDKAVLGVARFDNDGKKTYTQACFLAKQTDKSEKMEWQKRCLVKREFIVRSHRATIAR
jgi:hypothetical protein